MNWKSIILVCGVLITALAQEQPFLTSRQKFAFNLLKNTGDQSSILISPVSIDYALHVLLLGASKKTLSELRNNLLYPANYNLSKIETNLQNWTGEIKRMNGVEIATKMYINTTLQPQKAFNTSISKALNSQIEKIALTSNKLKAVNKINSWIANATHDLIKNMLSASSIHDITKFVIVNCIYFAGKWEIPFQKSSTRLGNFYFSNGTSGPMYLMNKLSFYNYGPSVKELNGASAVSLKYSNSSVSMLFVLPPNNTDFDTWLNKITKVNWTIVDNSLNNTMLNLTIPKFNITFEKDMKPILEGMRFKEIFTANANFDKMFTKTQKELNVCAVIHKTVISVDEVGTVAAGVTAVLLGSGRIVDPPAFTANRPFLFAIRSGPTVLFIGKYVG